MSDPKDEKAERLAAALRANLRRRKAQKARDDLSGLDPKRTDTPLHRGHGEITANAPENRPEDRDKT